MRLRRGDALVAQIAYELYRSGPLPLAELARRLRRREGAIRAALRDGRHFVAVGETKGRRWWLVGGQAQLTTAHRDAGPELAAEPALAAATDPAGEPATAERLTAA